MQADSNACIDGETLAAWADGGLRPAEAAIVEQHLSDCERCTAMLATFVRTTPAAAASEPWWRAWRLPWLVPVATAATALALWVAIPRNDTPPRPSPTAAPAPQDTANQEKAAPPREELSRSQPTLRERAEAKKEAAAPTPSIGALEKRAQNASPESQITRADEDQKQAREAAEALAVPEAPTRTLEADRNAQNAAAADARATGRLAATPTGAGAAATAAPAAAAPREPNPQAFRARQGLLSREIVSPNPASRWRIVSGNQVEHSTNGGTQWDAVSVPGTTTLTAGTSPAPAICWIVGRAGTVYLTTDGSRFTRVPFQEAIDLASVRATDGRRATVISIDGRAFRTDDQGVTWTPTP